MRVVKHWHKFPREVVDSTFLEVFKAKLDEVLGNLVLLKMSLLTAGRLEPGDLYQNCSMIFWSLAQPSPREGKPNPALSPVLTIPNAHFPFIVASGRQRESKKISATGEGGLLFFPSWLYGPYGYRVMGKSGCPNRCHRSQPTDSFPDRVLIGELVVKVDFLHILISVGISALPWQVL